ncbi:MAG: macro domain-containing protein [Clostridia bacterium]|nr:macro domain-containing protein [Clostridia bacterium]
MAFEIIRNDITRVAADAVVNTANPRPVIGGGTDSAVYRAAGSEALLAARQKIGDIPPGQAVSTPAFRLPANYIIHTVGPIWQGGGHGEREALRACYANSLALAEALGCESVAFPLISTGSYGFPKEEGLRIALEEIGRFLLTHEMRVILVVFDPDSLALSEGLAGEIDRFIDEHTVRELQRREYASPTSLKMALPSVGENDLPRRKKLESAGRGWGVRLPRRSRPKESREGDSPKEARGAEKAAEERVEPEAELLDACRQNDRPFPQEARESARESAREREAPAEEDGAWEASALPTAYPAALQQESLPDIAGKSLDEVVGGAGQTFQQKLFALIDASGMDDVTVYKKANIDRKVFSRIRCKEDYRPKKKTAVAFAIALELDMPAMLDLLSRAEIAFSPSSKFDLIVMYFVTHHIYDIFEINAALFKYGQPILGE